MSYFVVSLERELQGELELTHTGSRTRRGISLDVRYFPVARAVDARPSAALVPVEAQYRMVEHVENVHAELSFDPFRDREVLTDSRVSGERLRATETEYAVVTQFPEPGVSKWPSGGSNNVRNRREVGLHVVDGIELSPPPSGTTLSPCSDGTPPHPPRDHIRRSWVSKAGRRSSWWYQ